MTRPSTGIGLLVWADLRRDRVLLIGWLTVLTGVCYASAAATGTLYVSEAERAAAASAINASPAVVALYGPIVDTHSPGDLAMAKTTVLYSVFVALLVTVLVRRHTRTDEEEGQAELLGGTAIGRDSPWAAALVEAVTVALGAGLMAAGADIAGGLPVVGSMAFGASWAGIGLVATGLALVGGQLYASSRACAAVVGAALGGLYVLRAVGDTTVPWLGWLSPFGWSTRIHAWSEPRWWVLGLYLLSSGLLVGVARVLRHRRDVGTGLFPPRPGPAAGSPRLSGALPLSLRVHAPMLLGWTAALGTVGAVLGSVVPSIRSLLDAPSARAMMQHLGGVGPVEDTMLAAELSMLAVVVTCFAVMVIIGSARDESTGRADEVLSTAVSRTRMFRATSLVALLGSTWLLLVGGLALALGFAVASSGVRPALPRILIATLVQLPSVWVVITLAIAAYAVRSRWAVGGWILVAAFVTLAELGEMLRLPSWLIGLSPYVHTPRMPAEPFEPGALAVLCGVALVVGMSAWARCRARDVG